MGLLNYLKSKLFKTNSESTEYVPEMNKAKLMNVNKSITPVEPTLENFPPKDNTKVSTSSSPVQEESFFEKSKDFIAKTEEEVKSQGSALWEAVKEQVEILDEKTKPIRDKVVEKANDAIDKVQTYVDEKVEAAKKSEEEELNLDKDKDGFADKPIDFGEKATEKHSDFFSKAEDWLKKTEAKDKTDVNVDQLETKKNIDRLELPKE